MSIEQVRTAEDTDPADDTEIGELQVAEYVTFLLALDTWMRYLEEATGANADDHPVTHKGLMILRVADSQFKDAIQSFLDENLPTPFHKQMLKRAFAFRPTADGAGRRAIFVRTLLSRGGTGTMKAVFQSVRARREINVAIAASITDNADVALDKFAAIQMRNARIRGWIDLAAKTAGPGSFQNPVASATSGVADETPSLLADRAQQSSSAVASEESADAGARHEGTLLKVQQEAEDAARKAIEISGEEDKPPTRSEVIGIATAAAAAVASDPEDPKNIPPSLESVKNDKEQLAAALTDGRTIVAAGAGAGKSRTLIARVKYLVRDKGVSPSKIFVASFNTSAADNLKKDVAREIGPDVRDSMQIGTMHGLFRRFIRGGAGIRAFGTNEEVAMMSNENLVMPERGPKKRGQPADDEPEVMLENDGGEATNIAPKREKLKPPKPSQITYAIKGMIKDCGPDGLSKLTGFPVGLFEMQKEFSAKACKKLIENWRGNSIDFRTARNGAETIDELYASIWYEFYLGIKGDLGAPPTRDNPNGWTPPCQSRTFNKFNTTFRKSGFRRFGDGDDMIRIFRDILKRDSGARNTAQGLFDHVLVDEAQDLNVTQHEVFGMMTEKFDCNAADGKSFWIVGDDKQCVASDTPVSVPGGGTVHAGDLKPGDPVVAYRNGELVTQHVRHVVPTSWTWGYRITTESGRSLLMSPNHKIWATSPEMGGDKTVVYLMHRKDKGFRVGITNKCEDPENPYGSRAHMERADRMWLLDLCDSRDEALYKEEFYSLKYGVPTMVFEGEHRGLDQARIDRIFAEFGKGGARLLEDRHLSYDCPNWVSYSYTKFGTTRRTIQLIMHAPKGSQVALEWMGDDLETKLDGVHYVKLQGGRRRLRRFFNNYRDALAFAEELKERSGASLRKRLSTPEGPMMTLTASALVPTMCVAVESEGTVVHESLVSVEKVEGCSFVDLDVDDASNFFGDGILSSNSIYQFRGARPSLFSGLTQKECWNKRLIQTNYRSMPEIVEAGNNVAAHNEGQVPMQCRADPKKPRGRASIQVDTPPDYVDGAFSVLDDFERQIRLGAKTSDFAVLSRNNAELNAFEDQCILREIPYTRSRSKGFLDSVESTVVLGYMDLAMSSDSQQLQEAFLSAITKPDRELYLSGEAVEKIVKDAIKEAALDERVDSRGYNPLDFLTRLTSARKLAVALKAPYKEVMIARAKEIARRKGRDPEGRDRNEDYEWMYRGAVEELTKKLLQMGKQILDIRMAVQAGAKTDAVLDRILDSISVTNGYVNRNTDTRKTTTLREQIKGDIAFYRDPEEDDAGETKETRVIIDENGMRKVVQEADPSKVEDPLAGLGAVRYLYQLAAPNDKDRAMGMDPTTGRDFYRKIDRYKAISEELQDASKHPERIALSTIHSVKGSQWREVALCMSYGFFPGGAGNNEKDRIDAVLQKLNRPDPRPPAAREAASKALKDILEDRMVAERNIAYVGITRAQERLRVVCSQERVPPALSRGGTPVMGMFAREAGLKPGENVPPTGPAKDVAEPTPEIPSGGPVEPLEPKFATDDQGWAFSADDHEGYHYDRRQS